MGKNQRSPIEGVAIRRQAGQSASAKAEALIENMAAIVLFPFAVVVFTLIAEFMRRADGHLGVKGFVVLFMLAAAFSVWQYFKRRDAIRRWLMGANGERYVGQVLDREMTSRGYRVYHDIQIRKGRRQMNIDHLLVGPNGVFLIEDKTWSKPTKGQTVVKFDGKLIFKNGVPTKAPVVEAFALAKEANAYIKGLSGVSVPVKPVLVFVGWYNEAENRHESPLLVLSEKVLPNFLQNHRPQQVPTVQELRLVAAKLDAANVA